MVTSDTEASRKSSLVHPNSENLSSDSQKGRVQPVKTKQEEIQQFARESRFPIFETANPKNPKIPKPRALFRLRQLCFTWSPSLGPRSWTRFAT